jgi:hypothetical protein
LGRGRNLGRILEEKLQGLGQLRKGRRGRKALRNQFLLKDPQDRRWQFL